MSIEQFIISSLQSAIKAGTPLLFATLGEIYTERSGILNLGVEGIMIMGAVVGFGVSLTTNNIFLGILSAAIIGGILALIHGFLSISLRTNQIVSGIALTLFGLGMSGLVGRAFIGKPLPIKLIPISVPILSDIWIFGPSLFQHDPLVYTSVIMTLLLWIILFKTRIGINIRSVGENPATADALGVNVPLIRYLCTFLGGIFAGVGGAYLSVAYAPAWIEGMTAGRGWIAVALTIFAMWSPSRALIGAYLFGGIEAFQYRLQPFGISPNLLSMLPYLFTIFTLVIIGTKELQKRLGAPAALGIPYSREEEK